MEYTILLPLPPSCCSPNWSGHWTMKAEGVRNYKLCCLLLYRKEIEEGRWPKQFCTPISISLTFYYPRTRQQFTYSKAGKKNPVYAMAQDATNARSSYKNGQDALIEAGLIPSDSHRIVRDGPTRLLTKKNEHKGEMGVLVTITEEDV